MVWDALIAWYLFLAGLGAGAFVLGALSSWFKKPVFHLKRIAFIVAPVAVIVGTLILVIDAKAGLNNPLRFFQLISNLSSVMSWGVVILCLFIVVSALNLVILIVKKQTPKALDIMGILLAFCVAAYTGVLLGDAGIAFPLWNIALLPALFIVSAASSGCALVLLLANFFAPDEVRAVPLRTVGLVLPVVEAALVAVLLVVTLTISGSAASAAQASVLSLTRGAYALTFWGGLVLVGLVFPFCVELFHLRTGKIVATEGQTNFAETIAAQSMTLSLAGEVGVLIGGFTLRYLVVMAALPLVFGIG